MENIPGGGNPVSDPGGLDCMEHVRKKETHMELEWG